MPLKMSIKFYFLNSLLPLLALLKSSEELFKLSPKTVSEDLDFEILYCAVLVWSISLSLYLSLAVCFSAAFLMLPYW